MQLNWRIKPSTSIIILALQCRTVKWYSKSYCTQRHIIAITPLYSTIFWTALQLHVHQKCTPPKIFPILSNFPLTARYFANKLLVLLYWQRHAQPKPIGRSLAPFLVRSNRHSIDSNSVFVAATYSSSSTDCIMINLILSALQSGSWKSWFSGVVSG